LASAAFEPNASSDMDKASIIEDERDIVASSTLSLHCYWERTPGEQTLILRYKWKGMISFS
jgi:hypothetical protein